MKNNFSLSLKRRDTLINLLIILLIIIVFVSLAFMCAKKYYPLKYMDIVLNYSYEYNLDPSLVFAVIHTESHFDAAAVSHAGALGLMQITPDTFYWISSKDRNPVCGSNSAEDVLLVPETNIKYGCMILNSHINEFKSVETALAAYNAGRSRVRDWLENTDLSCDGIHLKHIPYHETDKYVKNVLFAQKIYRILYDIGG